MLLYIGIVIGLLGLWARRHAVSKPELLLNIVKAYRFKTQSNEDIKFSAIVIARSSIVAN